PARCPIQVGRASVMLVVRAVSACVATTSPSCQVSRPGSAFPKVKVGHQQACRAAVLGCQRLSLMLLIISCVFEKASQHQAIALTLERLLNQGINSGKVADQFLWDSEADPQVVGAGRTDPYPTILTLPDERFEGQIKR